MKKKVLMIVPVILMVLSIGIIMYVKGNDIKEKVNLDAIKFKKDYESLNGTKREKDGKTIRSITIPKKNPFVYKEAEDIVKMVEEKETFVVYFGFNDCPWCRSVVPTLASVANDLNLDTIYYVNVKDIRDTMKLDDENKAVTDVKGSKGYYKLLDTFSSVLADYTLEDQDGNEVETGEKRIFAPNIISVIDGKVTKLTEGISEKQTDGYMKLTKQMKNDMKKQVEEVLKPVQEAKTTCAKDKGC